MEIVEFNERLDVADALNNIVHGDCLDVMKALPDKSIDVIITSPPYNLRNSTGNGLKYKGDIGIWTHFALQDGYDGHNDDMPYDEYVDWQRRCLAEMTRIIKDDGAVFYNNKNRVQDGLIQDRGEIVKGFPLRQIITWKRKGSVNFNDGFYLPITEQIYLICRKPFKLAKGANHFTDVWEIAQEQKNPHPAPFPEELVERVLQSTTGKIILDPFGGSGTTGVVAKKHGRDFILIEQSQKYCELAKARIEGITGWREGQRKESPNLFMFL